jgi:pimeloyl-ACP methyl ester carboxylesterase
MVQARRLLLVHGFGGSRDDFTEWLPAFASLGWSAHALQLPGHSRGFSTQTGRVENLSAGRNHLASWSLAGLAGWVVGEADRLGWARFVLFGHSMGAMVAQLVALSDAGERLDGLILMGTTHGPIPVDRETVELGKSIVRSGGMAALVEAQRGRPGTPAHERLVRERAGYREFMEAKALAMDPEMWLAMVDEMLSQPDRLDDLRSLALATLVVTGEQDDFRADCERLAGVIPGARLAVVAGAGHSPQFESPDEWWQVVRSFLSDLEEVS